MTPGGANIRAELDVKVKYSGYVDLAPRNGSDECGEIAG